jgi:hypothetical protein
MSFRVSQTIETNKNKIVRKASAGSGTDASATSGVNEGDKAFFQKITEHVSHPSFFIASSNEVVRFNEKIRNKKVLYDSLNQQWKLLNKVEADQSSLS